MRNFKEELQNLMDKYTDLNKEYGKSIANKTHDKSISLSTQSANLGDQIDKLLDKYLDWHDPKVIQPEELKPILAIIRNCYGVGHLENNIFTIYGYSYTMDISEIKAWRYLPSYPGEPE